MVLEFFLLFGRLNLSSLPEDKKKMMEKAKLIISKAVMLFEYVKANKEYWDRSKLYHQVVNKGLPITEAFYLDYSHLFLFDNATSYLIYAKNVLRTIQMNKKIGSK